MSEFTTLMATDVVALNSSRVIEIQGREVAVFNVDGTFFALENTCSHRGGPIGEGELDDHTVTCPWHLWRFDVRTGECVNCPGDFVRTYELTVDSGKLRIRL